MKHTPGPWHCYMPRTEPGILVDKRGGRTVAKVSQSDMDTAEACANARLIAAAPELLEALVLTLRYLESPEVQALPFALPVAGVAERVRELISKATGEEV